MKRYQNILAGIISVGLFAACASTNLPSQELTQALTETQMVIQQAEQGGAQEFAPLELREAQRKLDLARQAVNDEKYGEAIKLTEHARIDAELAHTKALSAKAQKTVAELRESIRVLKEEIERKNTNR